MKQFKKALAMLLAVVMTFSLLPMSVFAAQADRADLAEAYTPSATDASHDYPAWKMTGYMPREAAGGNDGGIANALDNGDSTCWHSAYNSNKASGVEDANLNSAEEDTVRFAEIDLATPVKVLGLRIKNRSGGSDANRIANYTLKVYTGEGAPAKIGPATTEDPEADLWKTVSAVGAAKAMNENTWYYLGFTQPERAQYIRLYVTSRVSDFSIGEIRVVTEDVAPRGLVVMGDTNPSDVGNNTSGVYENHVITSGGTYSATNPATWYDATTKVKATSQSWANDGNNDRPTWAAVDGVNGNIAWHTRYSEANGSGFKGSNTAGSEAYIVTDAGGANSYLDLEIAEGAKWITGLRYLGRNSGDNVSYGNDGCIRDFKIQYKVNEGDAWTDGETSRFAHTGSWQAYPFTTPVYAKYIRIKVLSSGWIEGNSKNSYIYAKEVRLTTLTGEARSISGKVADKNSNGIAGARVQMHDLVATTDENGAFSFPAINPGSYKLDITAEGYLPQSAEIDVTAADASGQTITLYQRLATVTVKEGESNLTDATLMVEDADYTPQIRHIDANTSEPICAVTDNSNGTYTVNVSDLKAGDYHVRVSKDGYDVQTTNMTVEAVTAPVAADVPVEGGTAVLTQLTGAVSLSSDAMEKILPDAPPTAALRDGALDIAFGIAMNVNSSIVFKNKPMIDGVIEFDATRTGSEGYWGVVFRASQGTRTLVGEGETAGSYRVVARAGSEAPNIADGESNTIPFGVGQTRHFKVTVAGNKVTMTVDGITVINNVTIPAAASLEVGQFGFGHSKASAHNPAFTLHNLYVTRNDVSHTITLDSMENGSVSQIKVNGVTAESPYTAQTGDTVEFFTSAVTNYVLDTATVYYMEDVDGVPTEHAVEHTHPEEEKGHGSFTMPDRDVNIKATFTLAPTAIGAPTNVHARAGYGQVEVSWTAPDAGAAQDLVRYKVEVAEAENTGTEESPVWTKKGASEWAAVAAGEGQDASTGITGTHWIHVVDGDDGSGVTDTHYIYRVTAYLEGFEDVKAAAEPVSHVWQIGQRAFFQNADFFYDLTNDHGSGASMEYLTFNGAKTIDVSTLDQSQAVGTVLDVVKGLDRGSVIFVARNTSDEPISNVNDAAGTNGAQARFTISLKGDEGFFAKFGKSARQRGFFWYNWGTEAGDFQRSNISDIAPDEPNPNMWNDDRWHAVVITQSGRTVSTYYDGTQAVSNTFTLGEKAKFMSTVQNANQVLVGEDWIGEIGWVMITDEVVTAAQAKNLSQLFNVNIKSTVGGTTTNDNHFDMAQTAYPYGAAITPVAKPGWVLDSWTVEKTPDAQGHVVGVVPIKILDEDGSHESHEPGESFVMPFQQADLTGVFHLATTLNVPLYTAVTYELTEEAAAAMENAISGAEERYVSVVSRDGATITIMGVKATEAEGVELEDGITYIVAGEDNIETHYMLPGTSRSLVVPMNTTVAHTNTNDNVSYELGTYATLASADAVFAGDKVFLKDAELTVTVNTAITTDTGTGKYIFKHEGKGIYLFTPGGVNEDGSSTEIGNNQPFRQSEFAMTVVRNNGDESKGSVLLGDKNGRRITLHTTAQMDAGGGSGATGDSYSFWLCKADPNAAADSLVPGYSKVDIKDVQTGDKVLLVGYVKRSASDGTGMANRTLIVWPNTDSGNGSRCVALPRSDGKLLKFTANENAEGTDLRAIIAGGTRYDARIPTVTVTADKTSVEETGAAPVLTATTNPADQIVTWSSNNTNALTVDAEGVLNIEAPGTATITASFTIDGVTASGSIEITVLPPEIEVAAITDLAVTAGYSSQTLTWTAQSGVSYDVYVAESEAGLADADAAARVEAGRYVDANLPVGSQKWYKVVPYYRASETEKGQTKQAAAPTGWDALVARAQTAGYYGDFTADPAFNGNRVITIYGDAVTRLNAMETGTMIIVARSNVASLSGTNNILFAKNPVSDNADNRLTIGQRLNDNSQASSMRFNWCNSNFSWPSKDADAMVKWYGLILRDNGSGTEFYSGGTRRSADSWTFHGFLSYGADASAMYLGGPSTSAVAGNANWNGDIAYFIITDEVISDAAMAELSSYYTIAKTAVTGGSVDVYKAGATAPRGSSVVLVPTPAEHYTYTADSLLVYKTADGEKTALTLTDATYDSKAGKSFVMPAEAVTVEAAFTEDANFAVTGEIAPAASQSVSGNTVAISGTQATTADNYYVGVTVTVTVEAADGYKITSVTAAKADDADTTVELTRNGENNVWTFTMPAHAVKVTATIAAAEATPAAAIDFVNEKLTGLVSGGKYTFAVGAGEAGEPVTLTDTTECAIDASWFGQTIHIVKKGDGSATLDSVAQDLAIPARPEISLTIDNEAEGVTISDAYKYGTTDDDYANITTAGTGAVVKVAPSGKIYIYKVAVAAVAAAEGVEAVEGAFKSAVLTLTAPARAATPSVALNYETEVINTAVGMNWKTTGDWAAAAAANMGIADFGWNDTAAVTVKFQVPAGDDNYASEEAEVTIPVRPAAPAGEVVAPAHYNSPLTIDKLTAGANYQVRLTGHTAWGTAQMAGEDGAITVSAAGTYELRLAAVTASGSEALASKVQTGLEVTAYEPINVSTLTVEITGTATVGQTLSAEVKKDATPITGADAFAYQWKRDGEDIEGAAAVTYTLTNADQGRSITVTVTGSHDYTGNKTSEAVTVSGKTLYVKVENISATYDGTAKSITVTAWEDAEKTAAQITSGVTIEYAANKVVDSTDTADAWGNNQPGERKAAGDHKIWYKVVVAGYETVTGMATLTIGQAALAGTVTINNTAPVFGSTLTAVVTNVTHPGTELNYQWYQGDDAIQDATEAAYTVVAADMGKTIKVVVSAADTANYTAATLASDPTTAVAKADGPAAGPAMTINYADETVSGLLNTHEWATTDPAEDWTAVSGTAMSQFADAWGANGNTAFTLYVRTAATATHKAGAASSISIPARPTVSGVTGAAAEVIGGQGKLTGFTKYMPYFYRLKGQTSWIELPAEDVKVAVAPGTYEIYIAAHEPEAQDNEATENYNESVGYFKSLVSEVTVDDYTATPYEKPVITVDYAVGQLSGFEAGAEYSVSLDGAVAFTFTPSFTTVSADRLETLGWMGKSIVVTRLSDGVHYADSEPSDAVTVPVRANAPTTVGATPAAAGEGTKGAITGVTADMEYKAAGADSWTPCTDTSVEVDPGAYEVRVKGANPKFPSKPVSVTVGKSGTHNVNIDPNMATTHGSIKAEPAFAAADATVTITIEHDLGYVASNLTITAEDSGTAPTVDFAKGTHEYTITMPNNDITISADFVLDDVDLADGTAANANGAIALKVGGSEANKAQMDQTVTVEVTPDTGYELETLSYSYTVVDNGADSTVTTSIPVVANQASYTFQMPGAKYQTPVTVTAAFKLVHYTLSINLAGGNTAGNPSSYTVTDLPLTMKSPTRNGYVFKGWTCDELNITEPSIGAVIPAGTAKNLTFVANWEVAAHTIDYTGLVHVEAPAATTSVNHNAALTVTLIPDAGFAFPESVTITMGAGKTPVTEGFTYDKNTGTLSIEANVITDNIAISAVAKPIPADGAVAAYGSYAKYGVDTAATGNTLTFTVRIKDLKDALADSTKKAEMDGDGNDGAMLHGSAYFIPVSIAAPAGYDKTSADWALYVDAGSGYGDDCKADMDVGANGAVVDWYTVMAKTADPADITAHSWTVKYKFVKNGVEEAIYTVKVNRAVVPMVTLTFFVDGTPTIQTYNQGDAVTAPTPTKTGYALSWDKEIPATAQQDATFTAIWTANKHSLTLKLGDHITADKAAGDQALTYDQTNVVITLTAAAGYNLPDSVTVTMGGSNLGAGVYDKTTGKITIAKVTGDVVITADATGTDFSALSAAIAAAESKMQGVATSVDGSDVFTDATWATTAAKSTLQHAIAAAQAMVTAGTAAQAAVDAAVTTLNAAAAAFAPQAGTKVHFDYTADLAKVTGAFPTSVPQASAKNEITAKAAVQEIIDALNLTSGVTAEITKVAFTAAVAGTEADEDGTNGSYTFTVVLKKAGENDSAATATLTLNITATAYEAGQVVPEVTVLDEDGDPLTSTELNIAVGEDEEDATVLYVHVFVESGTAPAPSVVSEDEDYVMAVIGDEVDDETGCYIMQILGVAETTNAVKVIISVDGAEDVELLVNVTAGTPALNYNVILEEVDSQELVSGNTVNVWNGIPVTYAIVARTADYKFFDGDYTVAVDDDTVLTAQITTATVGGVEDTDVLVLTGLKAGTTTITISLTDNTVSGTRTLTVTVSDPVTVTYKAKDDVTRFELDDTVTSATLEVVATLSSGGTPTYTWYKGEYSDANKVVISGATGASYVATEAGTYCCEISGEGVASPGVVVFTVRSASASFAPSIEQRSVSSDRFTVGFYYGRDAAPADVATMTFNVYVDDEKKNTEPLTYNEYNNEFTVIGLEPEKAYEVYVEAVKADGSKENSATITITTSAVAKDYTVAVVVPDGQELKVGTVLTASAATASGESVSGVYFNWNWYISDNADGSDATQVQEGYNATYTVKANDAGKYIYVTGYYAGHDEAYVSGEKKSTVEGPIAAGDQKLYNITVVGGTLSNTQTTGKYLPGDQVTVSAPSKDNENFAAWVITGLDTTNMNLTQGNLTFTLPEDELDADVSVTITATYKPVVVTSMDIYSYVNSAKVDSLTTYVGASESIYLTIEVEEGNNTGTVTWTTSDASVVAILSGSPYGASIEIVGVGTATLTATSDATPTVSDTFVITVLPAVTAAAVTGAPVVGSTLTASCDVDADLAEYVTYQWQLGEYSGSHISWENIQGATGTTYEIQLGDVGHSIRVVVTGDGEHVMGSAASNGTGKVVTDAGNLVLLDIVISGDVANAAIQAPEQALEGETVTVTLIPDTYYSHYYSNPAVYILANGDRVDLSSVYGKTNEFTFIMPNEAVTLYIGVSVDLGQVVSAIEEALEGLSVKQANCNTEAAAKALVEAAIAELDLPESVEIDVDGTFTAAKTGTSSNKAGEDGSYEYTVTVTDTSYPYPSSTGTLTLDITATAYKAPAVPTTPPTTTEVVDNGDGTTTTIVTDNRTGTVTETTELEDGSVVEKVTEKDGTVTETVTQPDGSAVEKVTEPDGDVTVTVTDTEGEEIVKMALPAKSATDGDYFTDIPEDHWSKDSAEELHDMEILNGTAEHIFTGDMSMNRGMMAAILHRLGGNLTMGDNNFVDVLADAYYAADVDWAANVNVIQGVDAEHYEPDRAITRQELAVMMYRYAKLVGADLSFRADAVDSFVDADSIGSWASDAMNWAVSVGLLKGCGANDLCPTATATRAQVATVVSRFIALLK